MASIRSHTLLSAAHPATTFMNRLGFGFPSDYTLFISFNIQVKLFSDNSRTIFDSKSPGNGPVPSSGGMRHCSLHFGESHFPLKANVFMRSRQQVPHCHEYPPGERHRRNRNRLPRAPRRTSGRESLNPLAGKAGRERRTGRDQRCRKLTALEEPARMERQPRPAGCQGTR